MRIGFPCDLHNYRFVKLLSVFYRMCVPLRSNRCDPRAIFWHEKYVLMDIILWKSLKLNSVNNPFLTIPKVSICFIYLNIKLSDLLISKRFCTKPTRFGMTSCFQPFSTVAMTFASHAYAINAIKIFFRSSMECMISSVYNEHIIYHRNFKWNKYSLPRCIIVQTYA